MRRLLAVGIGLLLGAALPDVIGAAEIVERAALPTRSISSCDK